MRPRTLFSSLLFLALFLASAPTALASGTWYVDGLNGSDSNNCKSPQHACQTIGHAISLAHAGDSVMVTAATYKENLTISFSLQLIGANAKTTIIDGGGVGGVVQITSTSAHVTLSKVTIRNGFTRGAGGGIFNGGTLAINNSTIGGNVARWNLLSSGGGIYNDGTLRISNSTISGNFAFGRGGGIFNSSTSTVTINNSTISGNTAAHVVGGGIVNSAGTVTINNATLSGNSAPSGGGIYGTVTLQNSIVANSLSGGNCDGTMISNGYNLSSDNSCNFNGSGDLNNTDPVLGTLGYYGGPTQTIPLLSESPAIDAGNPSGCTDGTGHLLKKDQRGAPRHDKEDTGGCDMGAFERQKD